MGTISTLLATWLVAVVALSHLPAEWADDVALATVAAVALLAGLVEWARWQQLERTILAGLGWPGE